MKLQAIIYTVIYTVVALTASAQGLHVPANEQRTFLVTSASHTPADVQAVQAVQENSKITHQNSKRIPPWAQHVSDKDGPRYAPNPITCNMPEIFAGNAQLHSCDCYSNKQLAEVYVQFEPNPPVRGQGLAINLGGRMLKDFTGGYVRWMAERVVLGQLVWQYNPAKQPLIDFLAEFGDFDLPIYAYTNFTSLFMVNIPKNIPDAMNFRLEIMDSNEARLLCIYAGEYRWGVGRSKQV